MLSVSPICASMFQYGRGLRNFHAEQPHQHAVYYTSVLMSELLWTQEELLGALDGKSRAQGLV